MNKEYIKDFPVSKLKPYERNPRKNKHAVDVLAKSIQRVGNNDPIEVNEDYVILCGHTRKQALDKLNIKTTDIVMIKGLTEEQQNEYRITNNKTGEIAEWDFEVLEEDFSVEELVEFGFNIKDLTKSEVEEDEAPPVPETPRTVKGDIYTLSKHRVMCGDSTFIDDVEKLMDGKKADLYLTDPPYNVAYEGKTKDCLKIQNDSMSNDKFREFLKDAFINADLHMKGGAVFYVWHADSEGYNFRGACSDAGWKVRQCLIWNKNSMVMGRQDYHWKHEPCWYGWKDGAAHLWSADRKQTTVIEFKRPSKNMEHPTMKPVELFAYQIQNNTKNEDIVLDSFLGSGTSLIACEQTNRVCYGMELDEKYCDVIVQRWVNLTGGKVILNGQEIEWEKDNV